MSRIVKRDPFARQTLLARRIKNPGTTCHFCGGVRFNAQSRTNWLYQFYIEDDQGSSYSGDIEHLFCDRKCMEAYHNM